MGHPITSIDLPLFPMKEEWFEILQHFQVPTMRVLLSNVTLFDIGINQVQPRGEENSDPFLLLPDFNSSFSKYPFFFVFRYESFICLSPKKSSFEKEEGRYSSYCRRAIEVSGCCYPRIKCRFGYTVGGCTPDCLEVLQGVEGQGFHWGFLHPSVNHLRGGLG